MRAKAKIISDLKKNVQEFLDRTGFNFLHAPEVKEEDGRFVVDIFVDEPRQLIGERGKNLNALQHLIRLIIKKKHGNEVLIDIDVNGYKKKRSEFIRDMALSTRRTALQEGRDIEMEYMNPFDRRVVHSVLSEFDDIETESTGEGFNRRVVVKVKPNSNK